MSEEREQSLPIVGPSQGLVTGVPRFTIPERGWYSAKNARFRLGAAEKVPGYVKSQAAALDSQVMGLYDFNKTNGFQAWIAVTRTKIYKREPIDAAFVDITGAALTGNATEWASFTNFKDLLIITNGRDSIQKWDGVAATVSALGGSPPKAKKVTTFQNHVMLAWIDPAGAAAPQKIQWSDLGLAETWSGGEAGALSFVDEPSGILDIVPLRDSLIAYKDDAVYLVDYTGFPFTMSQRRLATGLGPISSRIVVPVRDAHFFLSNDGQIYRMTLSGPEPIGYNQARYDIFNSLDYSQRANAFGYLNDLDQEAVFAIPTSGNPYPIRAYILEYVDESWGVREFATAASAAAGRGVKQLSGLTWDSISTSWDAQTITWDGAQTTVGSPITLHADVSGYVYKHTAGLTDADTTAIGFDIESKMYDFGHPSKVKRLGKLYVDYDIAGGTTLSIYVLTSNAVGKTPTVNGPYTIVLDGSGHQWINVQLSALWFGFRFRNNASGQPCRITGYMPEFYTREESRF